MEYFPASVVRRLDAEDRTVRAFRELRELTRAQLAYALDVETGWVDEVEDGKRHPTEQEWRRLAAVLRVEAELLQS